MRFPVRPIRKKWPAGVEAKLTRFFWIDPTVVLDNSAGPEEFRAAMSAMNVGDTIKITGSNRHPAVDALLVDNIDLTDATIVDIGASDGSTSVDLINRIGDFKAYVIADLYLHITAQRAGRRTLFYDPDGTCILIVGARTVAWPSISKFVRTVYAPVISKAARSSGDRTEVLLLNPSARALVESDSRVSYQVHNIFQPWTGPAPDVIKVANLLRRLYFSDEEISQGLQRLHDALTDGGHLLMVDNSRIVGMPARGGLYRKDGARFAVVAESENTPEIADLIAAVGRA